MKWLKFENNVINELTNEERDILLVDINNPSAMHCYKQNSILNASNQSFTANEIETISQILSTENDN